MKHSNTNIDIMERAHEKPVSKCCWFLCIIEL